MESGQSSEASGKRGRKPISGLTAHQQRTLRAIRQYIEDNGISPTAADLSEALGLSRSTIQDQIEQLVRKGYLNRETGRARSVSIRQEPSGLLGTFFSVPIVGEVAAGVPILAQENMAGEILVESHALRGGKHFALEVKGRSMIDAGIEPGDLVIVRQQATAENGDIVVAMLEGEATVKRLWMGEGGVELRPENTDFEPIVIGTDDGLSIVGKVIAVRRRAQDQASN